MITLRDLISGPNYHAIPDMQRDYQWDIDGGRKHGRTLWENLVEFTNEDPSMKDSYYIGTMITYKEGSKWMVIDGQQRLTTLTIMFMAARDILDIAYSEGLRGELTINGQTIPLKDAGKAIARETIGTPKRPKLLPKEASQMNYKAFIGYTHPVDTRPDFQKKTKSKFLVVQAYEMFQRELTIMSDTQSLDGLQQLVSFLDHILDGVVITRTIVKDLAHGYRIFSTENTTGLKLGNLDIVRALILAQVDRKKMHNDLETIQTNLRLMMIALEPISKTDRDNFIRYFWILRYGTPMSKVKLTNSISNDIRNLENGTHAVELTKILCLAASNYSAKVVNFNRKQLYFRPHRDLIDCGFKQYRPVLLALSARGDISKQGYKAIFGIIETLYVRFLLVGRQKGSTLEPTLAAWAKQATDKNSSEEDLINKWYKDAISINETFDFEAAFCSMQVTEKNPKKYRYILSLIEEYSDENVEKKLLGASVAEPILPTVKDYGEWGDIWAPFNETHHAEGIQHLIGNYVLLRSSSGLSNSDGWSTRSDFYERNGRFRTTREFASNAPYMDKTIIQDRTQKLARKASEIWKLERFILT